MWTSVPQIALFRMRMRTSWTPTSGSGASRTREIPSRRSSFDRAFNPPPAPGADSPEVMYALERAGGPLQVEVARPGGRGRERLAQRELDRERRPRAGCARGGDRA